MYKKLLLSCTFFFAILDASENTPHLIHIIKNQNDLVESYYASLDNGGALTATLHFKGPLAGKTYNFDISIDKRTGTPQFISISDEERFNKLKILYDFFQQDNK